jgi:hypothetical protein
MTYAQLMIFGKITYKNSNHVNDGIRKWTPERFISGRDSSKSCCVQCGINHEEILYVQRYIICLTILKDMKDTVLSQLIKR